MSAGQPDGDARLRYAVYFTKGLGDVALAELTGLVPEAMLAKQRDRFAVAELPAAAAAAVAATARTIDDLRLLLAGPAPVRTEEEFTGLCRRAAAAAAGHLGGRDGIAPWSVTLAARRPVWRQPPAWDPGPVIAACLGGADLRGTRRQPVDLRVQADGEDMHISLNLEQRPGGRTDDLPPPRPGALRPTVAAAIVRLAVDGVHPDVLRHGVYDPFCGTGTLVAEALRLSLPVFASDLDEQAVLITRDRLARLGAPGDLSGRVFRHDVRRGLPTRVPAMIVVGNLPWGKQVALARRGELFDATAALAGQVLARGGGCALLSTHADQLVARIRRHADGARTGVRRIGLLGQTPAIVTAHAARPGTGR